MGIYVLALRLDEPRMIVVGCLGEILFPAGWYVYVGSARGTGGLRARLARHRRRASAGKRLHWHVDHLREHTTWGGAWARQSHERLECDWATALDNLATGLDPQAGPDTPSLQIIAPGFGASDCRCISHLRHTLTLPDDQWFATTLGAERIRVDSRALEGLLQELTTGHEQAREAAALSLRHCGEVATTALADILDSSDAEVRWWAVRALAEAGGDGAVALLVGTLGDPDPDVRACAALALGHIGDCTAAPFVAARLADESPFVASIAADALSMIGEGAIEALTGMLEKDSPHGRLLAVRALSRIKSQRTIGPLLGVLEDPSYLVRFYAREALEELGVGMVYVKP